MELFQSVKRAARRHLPELLYTLLGPKTRALRQPLSSALSVHYYAWRASVLHPSFENLSIRPSDREVPLADRSDTDERVLSERQRFWRRNGYLILPGLIPSELIQRYEKVRQNRGPIGWLNPLPYLHVPQIRDLGLHSPLRAVLNELIGEEMCLSLGLTAYVSTQRNWHQDDYLNPPEVMTYYLAVWIALDDIHPDAGPFQYVPGSHRWPLIRGSRVKRWLHPSKRSSDDWPKQSESVLDGIFEKRIKESGLEVKTFLPKKGDVLVWHSRLAHRGSVPKDERRSRKSLILHYTADGRELGAKSAIHSNGGKYLIREGFEKLY